MGFFSDLKEDLFHGVNAGTQKEEPIKAGHMNAAEMMPEECEKPLERQGEMSDSVPERAADTVSESCMIPKGMIVKGDIVMDGSLKILGTVNGDIKATLICAEGAKICGALESAGEIKIDASTVVIGNITAKSALVAGAVKGDIDVKGPVILEASAIVMGNIRSKSVQIDEGAAVEGVCSQCYADVSPASFFDECKA